MIAIVDYGMGNVGSVRNALRLLGMEAVVTSSPEDFARATHIILPGVGAFVDGMQNLHDRGLPDILAHEVQIQHKPFLGICLGMQLLSEIGYEGGVTPGLGWIPGQVRRLRVDESTYRLPHIGWDDVTFSECPLFTGITSPDFYFVHSFVFDTEDTSVTKGTCTYGETFTAAVQKDNVYGVQFHPEKSQKSGLRLLQNFVMIC